MKNIVKKLLAISLTGIMALSLAACGSAKDDGSTADPGSDEPEISVAMALPGLITDEAFNQFTYEGMKRACDEDGIKMAYKENVTQDEQVEVLRQFAQNGYSIVIGDGGQFGDALATVAEEYPDTQFVFTVATDTYDLPNLTAATISYAEAGYLAGVLAGLNTKNNKVAFVTGEFYDPHRQMEAGFIKGVASINPDIETTSVTTGDWADTVKAREASLALISQGYDVLFPCLDAAGAGVAAAAQDSEGVMIVGSVADYAADYGADDVTIGSMVYAWDTLGYLAAKGEFCDGKSHVIGMADEGITPVINMTLDDDAQATFDQAVQDLKDGKIVIG